MKTIAPTDQRCNIFRRRSTQFFFDSRNKLNTKIFRKKLGQTIIENIVLSNKRLYIIVATMKKDL